MNLNQTRKFIKTATQVQMDEVFDFATKKLASKSPAIRMGAAMILDELVIEQGNRRQGKIENDMSDAELLAALS